MQKQRSWAITCYKRSTSAETEVWRLLIPWFLPKIQQTKMLVTCQRFGDLFLFGLVWQYSSIQKNIVKVGSKSWILTCSCHITLSLPFYTDPASKRELNFSNGYLSLLYFWLYTLSSQTSKILGIDKTSLMISSHLLLGFCHWNLIQLLP